MQPHWMLKGGSAGDVVEALDYTGLRRRLGVVKTTKRRRPSTSGALAHPDRRLSPNSQRIALPLSLSCYSTKEKPFSTDGATAAYIHLS